MKELRQSQRRFCAIIIGLVFLFSGILKLMDPVGTKLIVEGYLKFFHVAFLSPAAMVFGLVLSLTEALTGAALVSGVYRKAAAWSSMVLLLFFTAVTFILWVSGSKMECGCFGEAIHLTPFQSFLKNGILRLLWAGAFLPLRALQDARGHNYVCFWIVAVSMAAFMTWSLLHIPLVDFTPFNLSSRLAVAEEADPAGAGNDQIVVFIYEKNGQQGSFNIDNLPDSTWTFVRQEMLSKEDNIRETSFPSLPIFNESGATLDSLAAGPLVLAISVYEPEEMSQKQWEDAADLLADAAANGFRPLLLVSSGNYVLPDSRQFPPVYRSDYKTLISLNRSNGGASYFNEGNLIQKWSWRQYDDVHPQWIASADATETMITASTRGRLTFQAFLLYTLALLLIL